MENSCLGHRYAMPAPLPCADAQVRILVVKKKGGVPTTNLFVYGAVDHHRACASHCRQLAARDVRGLFKAPGWQHRTGIPMAHQLRAHVNYLRPLIIPLPRIGDSDSALSGYPFLEIVEAVGIEPHVLVAKEQILIRCLRDSRSVASH